jgi:hypothetical protein
MALYLLGIAPDSNGYTAVAGNSNVAIQLDGGAPRVRADKVGMVSVVDVQWSLNPTTFDYMCAFFRTGTNSGASPFQIELVGIDGSTPALYTAQFVPGTFQLKSQSGLTYVIGAQLWVAPQPYDPNEDYQLLGLYS